MGSDPFGLEVKRKRDLANLGFDAEEGAVVSYFHGHDLAFSYFFSVFGI